MAAIRVCIVEDDPLIREALSLFLNGSERFELIGIHDNAEDFLRHLSFSQPDVVLMDIQLPGMNGIECIRRTREMSPGAQCMVCSVFEDEENIFEALRAGANGYLLKNESAEDMKRYIEELHRGQSPMSAPIARKVIGHFRDPRLSSQSRDLLSQREQEILEHLSRGYRYKEIADRLFLSPETVRTHIRNIYSKLQVDNRMEAINKAFRR